MRAVRSEHGPGGEEFERLRRSEARLLQIVSAAGESFFEVDAELRFTFVTQAVEALLCVPVDQVLGRSLLDFVADDEVLRVAACFEEAAASETTRVDFELRTACADGRETWLRVKAQAFADEDGQVRGYRGSASDISEQKRFDSERETLRRRLDRAVRATRDGLFEWPDLTQDVVWLAPTLAADLGFMASGMTNLADVLASIERADRPRLRAALRAHLDEGQPFDVEFRSARGARVFVARGEASRDDQGQLSLVGSVRDVTLQRRESQLLRLAVRAARQGFFEVDLRSGAYVLDRALFTRLGYAPDQVPEHADAWEALIHEEDRASVVDAMAACRDGHVPACDVEYRVMRADGSWSWIRSVAEGVRDAATRAVVRLIGLHQDVDARRRAVDELANAKLAAERASSAKSDFLANMSHEIRTPMTAILGFADMALDEEASIEERRARLETVRRNGQHLLAILGDILDLSKIEANKLELERVPVDLPALLEEIRTSMAIRAEGKGIRCALAVEGELPSRILSDPVRIRQILLNLVGNAIKFTERGEVKLLARATRSETEPGRYQLVLRVVDTGRGMDEGELVRVFQPFTQADTSTTREFGGSGLGLSICRRLVDLLGGRLEAFSRLGVGSEFVVTLDVEAAGKAAESSTRSSSPTLTAVDAAPANLNGLRLLLAEDGEDNRRLLSHFLQRAGAEVSVACDGLEAYERVTGAATSFDLIIMDMQMPRMDGYLATSSLRAAGVTTPILALTAHAMRGDAERCLAAGCDAYATKPIGAKKLIALCHGLWLQHGADLVGA